VTQIFEAESRLRYYKKQIEKLGYNVTLEPKEMAA
jgi:hypothetical protein